MASISLSDYYSSITQQGNTPLPGSVIAWAGHSGNIQFYPQPTAQEDTTLLLCGLGVG